MVPTDDLSGDPGASPADGVDASVDALEPACCQADGQCPEGQTCRLTPGGGGGACVPSLENGRCWTDVDCTGGARCMDPFVCPCEDTTCPIPFSPGTCTPVACCGAGTSCPAGQRCVGEVATDYGICVPPPPAGQCWEPVDCTGETYCAGQPAAACYLPDLARQPPSPEVCLPLTPECCIPESGCPPDTVCVMGDLDDGTCLPVPVAGRCYQATDCVGVGQTCEGAVRCSCEQEGCVPLTGACVDAPGHPCCYEDAACGGATCALSVQGGAGSCLPDPGPGACWDDADCGAGQFCKGEAFCPCATECANPDVQGTCTALPTGCCVLAANCGANEVCLGASSELPGRCLPDAEGPACPDGGCCWTGDECGGWSPTGCGYCDGASYCPCVEACPECDLECPTDTMGGCAWVDPCL